MNIIETKNLSKSYADFTAVSNLSLHVPKGTVYGFVGPNGAGKSTTMKMLLGLTRPSGGTFVIDRKSYPHNRVKILKEIGSFIEAPAFYGNLTGEENLDIIRQILGLPRSIRHRPAAADRRTVSFLPHAPHLFHQFCQRIRPAHINQNRIRQPGLLRDASFPFPLFLS